MSLQKGICVGHLVKCSVHPATMLTVQYPFIAKSLSSSTNTSYVCLLPMVRPHLITLSYAWYIAYKHFLAAGHVAKGSLVM